MHRHPWSQVPRSVAAILEPTLPDTVDDTIRAIAREIPAYRGAWDGEIGPTVRRGVEIALGRMLALLGTDDDALDAGATRFYGRIGAGENEQGRSLEALLSAYRTGARVSWEHVARAALASEMPAADLVALAESIFVYIDELSAASADGHARAQAVRLGYQGIVRAQLAEALVEGLMASDPTRVAELAESAAWPLPRRLAVAVVPVERGTAGPPLPTAPPDVLTLGRGDEVIAVLPDPSGPGRRQRLTAAAMRESFSGTVYVGTVRPPQEAPVSLAHAVRVRALVDRGILPADQIVAAADHLPELVLAADERLGAELAERALRPLAGLSPGRRDVLETTLAAWLDLAGDRAAVAERLVVHPQTVSYRMGRLQQLMGEHLADPRSRFTLQLALHLRGVGVGVGSAARPGPTIPNVEM